ncbi:MAG TPA: DUF488 domain-containing protein [Nocardioides sp.]|uniref:DUF488 domain-containing protein n=1 Tax=Nocardioides sp. TaxID=35761 RepID=UPI002EDA6B5A
MTGVLTAGHGTASRDELAALLQQAGVDRVCDIRRFPGSRHNPAVARDALATWLPDHGIAYRWEPRLGGRRRVPAGQDPAVDGWWRVTAFRAYAAHMRTPEFADGMAELLRLAAADRTLILCSEAVWWRCHRRLVADALTLLHDTPVHHLMHDGTLVAHPPSEGARVTADGLRYDATPAPSTRVPVS